MTTARGAEPGWLQDVIRWHVHRLGFVGAEREATPDQPAVRQLVGGGGVRLPAHGWAVLEG